MDPWTLAHPWLRNLVAYQPGKPIEDVARELGLAPEEIIKLASNENPLGPSPKALAAMQEALTKAHFYPDGGGFYLSDAIAKHAGLARENVVLGAGSNELIELLGHAFLTPERTVVTSQYAFIVYKLVATLFGARTVEVPAVEYGFDLDGLLAAITPETSLVFIANPNNPTGTLLTQEQIDKFMAQVPPHVVVVWDEAYYEFLENPPDVLRYVREGRNVIALRTFSKIQGLANLRIGYGLAPQGVVELLQKVRQPFNTTGIGQVGALASLEDGAHQQRTRELTVAGRAYLEQEFTALGLEWVPSAGNFILVRVGDGRALFQALLKQGIIVRDVVAYGLPEWVRISIGTMEQNHRLAAALRALPPAAVA